MQINVRCCAAGEGSKHEVCFSRCHPARTRKSPTRPCRKRTAGRGSSLESNSQVTRMRLVPKMAEQTIQAVEKAQNMIDSVNNVVECARRTKEKTENAKECLSDPDMRSRKEWRCQDVRANQSICHTLEHTSKLELLCLWTGTNNQCE